MLYDKTEYSVYSCCRCCMLFYVLFTQFSSVLFCPLAHVPRPAWLVILISSDGAASSGVGRRPLLLPMQSGGVRILIVRSADTGHNFSINPHVCNLCFIPICRPFAMTFSVHQFAVVSRFLRHLPNCSLPHFTWFASARCHFFFRFRVCRFLSGIHLSSFLELPYSVNKWMNHLQKWQPV